MRTGRHIAGLLRVGLLRVGLLRVGLLLGFGPSEDHQSGGECREGADDGGEPDLAFDIFGAFLVPVEVWASAGIFVEGNVIGFDPIDHHFSDIFAVDLGVESFDHFLGRSPSVYRGETPAVI